MYMLNKGSLAEAYQACNNNLKISN